MAPIADHTARATLMPLENQPGGEILCLIRALSSEQADQLRYQTLHDATMQFTKQIQQIVTSHNGMEGILLQAGADLKRLKSQWEEHSMVDLHGHTNRYHDRICAALHHHERGIQEFRNKWKKLESAEDTYSEERDLLDRRKQRPVSWSAYGSISK